MDLLDDVSIPESVVRRSYAFDRFAAAAAVLDAAGVVVETNEAWRLFAILNEASPDRTTPGVDYLAVCDRAHAAGAESAGAVAAGLRAILRGERASFELEYACPSPLEDRWFVLHATTAPVLDGAGVVLFHVNVTSRKLLEERLDAEPEQATVTGLQSRRAGMRLIVEGLARARAANTRLTVIRLSVDGLVFVEEQFGRPAADEIMVQVTARALRALRADDNVGLLGDDDLVMVCLDLDDADGAGIVRRLENAIAAPFQFGATEVALGVDIGVASSGLDSTAIGLLAAASAVGSDEVRAARLLKQRARAASRSPTDIRIGTPLPAGRAAAMAMEIARAQRDAVLAHSSDLVLYLEADGTIVWASPALQRRLGIDPTTLIGRSGFDMIHPDDLERALTELGTIVALGDHARTELRLVTDAGDILWVEETVTNLVDDPLVGYLVVNLRDISERKRFELDFWHQANHDALTGLANRTLLLEELATAMTPGPGSGGSGEAGEARDDVGVLVFDVDRFKSVNDSLGHDHGDQVLVAIADALRSSLEPGQTAARFGSDAFVVVAPHLAGAAEALEIAARVRKRLGEGLVVGEDLHRATVSVGIVVARGGDTPITALRDAESAMYRAKEQGRDRVEWFDPALHAKVFATFEMERDLREAIDRDQLYLVFQPVLDLDTNRTSSCEALVRWLHPRRGQLSPDEFIPVAESTGLIVPLGRWVFPHALATAAGWPEAVEVAVNLSAAELAEPDLVAFVHATLTALDFPAARLAFEITETAVIREPVAAARAIAGLRALGAAVIIDDFGTGYTSLSFLRDYKIDGLKIDRSFVTDLEHGSSAIVDAMIRMSAALGLEVIAEGIETQPQLEALRALGCRFIQGYLISRPVPARELRFPLTCD